MYLIPLQTGRTTGHSWTKSGCCCWVHCLIDGITLPPESNQGTGKVVVEFCGSQVPQRPRSLQSSLQKIKTLGTICNNCLDVANTNGSSKLYVGQQMWDVLKVSHRTREVLKEHWACFSVCKGHTHVIALNLIYSQSCHVSAKCNQGLMVAIYYHRHGESGNHSQVGA